MMDPIRLSSAFASGLVARAQWTSSAASRARISRSCSQNQGNGQRIDGARPDHRGGSDSWKSDMLSKKSGSLRAAFAALLDELRQRLTKLALRFVERPADSGRTRGRRRVRTCAPSSPRHNASRASRSATNSRNKRRPRRTLASDGEELQRSVPAARSGKRGDQLLDLEPFQLHAMLVERLDHLWKDAGVQRESSLISCRSPFDPGALMEQLQGRSRAWTVRAPGSGTLAPAPARDARRHRGA